MKDEQITVFINHHVVIALIYFEIQTWIGADLGKKLCRLFQYIFII